MMCENLRNFEAFLEILTFSILGHHAKLKKIIKISKDASSMSNYLLLESGEIIIC